MYAPLSASSLALFHRAVVRKNDGYIMTSELRALSSSPIPRAFMCVPTVRLLDGIFDGYLTLGACSHRELAMGASIRRGIFLSPWLAVGDGGAQHQVLLTGLRLG